MHHGVIFSFGSAKVCSPAIFETCFCFDKDIWIASTDYYMYFYIIVLFSINTILQLINCRDFSHILHICTRPHVDSFV